jgi:toxin ParE1/3/4
VHIRLSNTARDDIAYILATSHDQHGADAKARYATLITTALRRIARDPYGNNTRRRSELGPDLHSFHLRHARGAQGAPKVARPVHIVFYHWTERSGVFVLRVLHERMEPNRHLTDTL